MNDKVKKFMRENNEIIVSHVTIHQSIFFLILRLIVIELVAATGIIVIHAIVTDPSVQQAIGSGLQIFNVPLFLVLVSVKTFLMIFVVFQWLEDYYEIFPDRVVHKKGFLFKQDEKYKLEFLGSLEVYQGILGKFFNYGTLKMYHINLDKKVELYLIHNPMKYYAILKQLIPDADEEKHTIRDSIIDEDRQ